MNDYSSFPKWIILLHCKRKLSFLATNEKPFPGNYYIYIHIYKTSESSYITKSLTCFLPFYLLYSAKQNKDVCLPKKNRTLRKRNCLFPLAIYGILFHQKEESWNHACKSRKIILPTHCTPISCCYFIWAGTWPLGTKLSKVFYV